jgi:hypothetical protein
MYAYDIICILNTIQKNALKPNPQPRRPRSPASRKTKKTKPAPAALLRTRFSARQLLRHFHKLLPVSLLAGWL